MIFYLKTHRRRPVQLGQSLDPLDEQEAIPRWWCRICGREIYVSGQELCAGCAKLEMGKGESER